MAEGIRNRFNTDIGLATTGIAGPTGGSPDKPVGLVWMGISTPSGTRTFACHFEGDRLEVMRSTVNEILTRLLTILRDSDEVVK
jgi:PncC family amidohydrolase